MKSPWIIPLVAGNLTAILASNIGLRLSAAATDWRGVLTWQIVGNLCGFLGVLCFTGLLRYVPLNVGHGLTQGLGFILVQVVGARIIFREPVTSVQWLGATLAVLGISLIAFGAKG